MEFINILYITEIFISVVGIMVILIQNKSVTLNLSNMSGGMNQIKKRGPEKVFHITTIVLFVLFILNSISIYVLS